MYTVQCTLYTVQCDHVDIWIYTGLNMWHDTRYYNFSHPVVGIITVDSFVEWGCKVGLRGGIGVVMGWGCEVGVGLDCGRWGVVGLGGWGVGWCSLVGCRYGLGCRGCVLRWGLGWWGSGGEMYISSIGWDGEVGCRYLTGFYPWLLEKGVGRHWLTGCPAYNERSWIHMYVVHRVEWFWGWIGLDISYV